MEFNRSEIMKTAWNLYRTTMKYNRFGECLKESWKIAKAATEKKAFTGKKPVTVNNYTFQFWQGGSNRRIYINGNRTFGSYIDLNTMERRLSRKANWDLGPAVEAFLNAYTIAC